MTNTDIQGDLPPSLTAQDIQKMADTIIGAEAPDISYEICIALVDSAEMEHYNKLYRGVARNTDVLSFASDILLLDGHPTRQCDIIIDTNQVFMQKGSKTFKEEFWQVLIHGLLHICGYDHIRAADKRKMEDAEDNYRKQIPGGGIGY